MLKKFLKEVVVMVAGKPAEEIADLLDSNKHVNEFVIAKKLNMTINQTRNILYRISDHGLVSSIRKKDKKKGWYTYFWKIEILKTLEFLRNMRVKNIYQIDNQIKNRETREFYVCEKCNIEFNEENALLHNFTCNECGNVFTIKNKTKVLKELKKNSDKLKAELELIDGEIKKERDKLDKKRAKELKKEKKEKEKKRAEATAKRRLARKKLMKLKPKKEPAKKKIKKKIVKKPKKKIKSKGKKRR
ncbi:transcription initiation factor E subunit alpha [archaeon BMS3Abin17]|nr:transcription initiation factor E subunit alpha [archaeon BMS3Abin17]HDZ60619.1 hypothetical protein [Candidatus Pacearchaeota archaeon]